MELDWLLLRLLADGPCGVDVLAESADVHLNETMGRLERLASVGYVTRAGASYHLTEKGRAELAAHDARERRRTIKTSSEGWLAEAAKAYKARRPITLIDDAGKGIDPNSDSLRDMGIKAGLRPQDWAGVLVALGVAVTGVGMLLAAVFDPEPISKLGLLVGGGAVAAVTGGFLAVRILTGVKPPKVRGKAGPSGGEFEIDWE